MITGISFQLGPRRYIFGYDDLRYRFAAEITDSGDPVNPIGVSEPSTLVFERAVRGSGWPYAIEKAGAMTLSRFSPKMGELHRLFTYWT
jgi:hypothetical protein